MNTEELRSFFNHELADDAANEIEKLESENDKMRVLLRECNIVLEVVSPHSKNLRNAISKTLSGE